MYTNSDWVRIILSWIYFREWKSVDIFSCCIGAFNSKNQILWNHRVKLSLVGSIYEGPLWIFFPVDDTMQLHAFKVLRSDLESILTKKVALLNEIFYRNISKICAEIYSLHILILSKVCHCRFLCENKKQTCFLYLFWIYLNVNELQI